MGVLRGHRRGIWSVQFSPVDQVLHTSCDFLSSRFLSSLLTPFPPSFRSASPPPPSPFPPLLPSPSFLLSLYIPSLTISFPPSLSCSPYFFPLFSSIALYTLSYHLFPSLPLLFPIFLPSLLPSYPSLPPLSQCVLTASADTTLKLWAVSDCSCIKTFEGHTMSVLKAVFITRGMQIASRSPMYNT